MVRELRLRSSGIVHLALVALCLWYAFMLAQSWRLATEIQSRGAAPEWWLEPWNPALMLAGPVVIVGLVLAAVIIAVHLVREVRRWYL